HGCIRDLGGGAYGGEMLGEQAGASPIRPGPRDVERGPGQKRRRQGGAQDLAASLSGRSGDGARLVTVARVCGCRHGHVPAAHWSSIAIRVASSSLSPVSGCTASQPPSTTVTVAPRAAGLLTRYGASNRPVRTTAPSCSASPSIAPGNRSATTSSRYSA